MKAELLFEDLLVQIDVSKIGLIAIHRSLDPTENKRGYILTHVPSLRVICWAPKKATALLWRKELEALDWEDQECVRKAVQGLTA